MSANAAQKQMGRWKPGVSGNPTGKRQGTKNKASLLLEKMFEGEAEEVGRVAVNLAKAGDTTALRLILDRLAPIDKDRAIPPRAVSLPHLEAGTMALAVSAVIGAVVAGRLTPSEGQALTALLEAHRKAVETEDLERRLSALEESREVKP